MAYTQADLDKVEEAIRIAREHVSLSTGDRTEIFQKLSELRALRDEIKEELKISGETPRQRLFVTRTRKGL